MERRLSKETIDSFCGNVVPLRLLGGKPYTAEAIEWRAEDPETVWIRSYNYGKDPFTDGVLLTLLKPGKTRVIASFEGKEYVCTLSVHERLHAESGRDLNYYIGDFHDHTSNDHKRATFILRTEKDFPKKYLEQIKEEGLMDFTTISDHACVLNGREFYRGYADDEDTDPKDFVVFPGSEAEVTYVVKDRYDQPHRNSGEIVTINSTVAPGTHSWEDFFNQIAPNPFTICCFAHPQISGHSTPGIWNFDLDHNNDSTWTNLFRLVETGDGSDRQANLINEYVYSVALDNGFRVSPTCSSDSHGPVWGYWRFPGKTIIMAPEKSKEAFIDAVLSNRVYASSTGNVKLYWEVNGHAAPCTLPETEHYHFKVSISYFESRIVDKIVRCQVISNNGDCLLDFDCTDQNELEFDIESGKARYFYLRLSDYFGKKTWSCPIWTGRPPVEKDTTPLEPLDKAGFTAVDEVSGEDASILVNNDPTQSWRSVKTTCAIVIDLHRTETIAALSHYPKIISQAAIRAEGLIPPDRLAFLPSRFRISTGTDGENYTVRYEGQIRTFGAEEVFRFEECEARYVKFEVLSTVGKETLRKNLTFNHALVDLAELTVWKKA